MDESLGSDQRTAWSILLRTPGIGPGTLRPLLSRHGSALAVVEHLRGDRDAPSAARAWVNAPDERALDQDHAWYSQPNHHLITWDNPDYPALLRDIPSAPIALFVVGDPTALWLPQIAIVGARNATGAGVSNARAFAKTFAQAGIAVTSGLAEGIDGAAHAATLDAGGITLAVFGTGPDVIYPRDHEKHAARIVERGALISEFPPGTLARPEFFPRRNRIIAGLSLGTLVVEASLKSGSLITARYAAEQGRDVFALPGPIHSMLSRGCHKLIRDGAKLVETADEVLEELRGMGAALAAGLRKRLAAPAIAEASAVPSTNRAKHAHDPDYACLFKALDHTPVSIDELSARSGLPPSSLSSMLLVLELDGTVKVNAGRYALSA